MTERDKFFLIWYSCNVLMCLSTMLQSSTLNRVASQGCVKKGPSHSKSLLSNKPHLQECKDAKWRITQNHKATSKSWAWTKLTVLNQISLRPGQRTRVAFRDNPAKKNQENQKGLNYFLKWDKVKYRYFSLFECFMFSLMTPSLYETIIHAQGCSW